MKTGRVTPGKKSARPNWTYVVKRDAKGLIIK